MNPSLERQHWQHHILEQTKRLSRIMGCCCSHVIWEGVVFRSHSKEYDGGLFGHDRGGYTIPCGRGKWHCKGRKHTKTGKDYPPRKALSAALLSKKASSSERCRLCTQFSQSRILTQQTGTKASISPTPLTRCAYFASFKNTKFQQLLLFFQRPAL